MGEFAYRPSHAVAPPSLEQEALYWQEIIGQTTLRGGAEIRKMAVTSLNKLMRHQSAEIVGQPILCWGDGYLDNASGKTELEEYKGSSGERLYGISEGVDVIRLKSAGLASEFLLTHTVSLIPKNSIRVPAEYSGEDLFHLPVSERNFYPLGSLRRAFRSRPPRDYDPRQSIASLAENYALGGNPVKRDNYSRRLNADNRRTAIKAVEAKIGYKGIPLLLRSDHGYVIDLESDAALLIRPDTALRMNPKLVTFLGVGDFASFFRSDVKINKRFFNSEDHDGLFIAVALADNRSHNASLSNQAVFIPLSGNSYHYQKP